MINNLLAASSLNAVDIVILIIFGISVLSGFIKGFSKMFVKFLGGIVSLVLAIVLCSKCAELLNDKFNLINALSNVLKSSLSGIFGEDTLNLTLGELQTNGVTNVSGPAFILNLLVGLVDKGVSLKTTVGDAIAPMCAYYLSVALGFIICYVLLKILFAIVGSILNKIVKLAMLGMIDRLLGLVLGAIKGFITCYILLLIANFLPIPQLTEWLGTSSLAGIITSVNLAGLVFGNINPSDYINDLVSQIK